jgi:hypothetical protein
MLLTKELHRNELVHQHLVVIYMTPLAMMMKVVMMQPLAIEYLVQQQPRQQPRQQPHQSQQPQQPFDTTHVANDATTVAWPMDCLVNLLKNNNRNQIHHQQNDNAVQEPQQQQHQQE